MSGSEGGSIRVLHFCKNSPDSPGGMEQVIHQLARGAAAQGVLTDVLHLSRDPNERGVQSHGYETHRARLDLQLAATGMSASAFLRFARLAKHADVIHYHYPWPFMDVVHFATRARKPALVTYHADITRQKYLSRLYRPLQQRFLTSVDRIVATSANYAASSPVLQHFANKVSVIPIGLDQASYPLASGERLAHWQHRLGKGFFLFVGVLRYYKGLHVLIEAAQGLDFPIVIVGAGPIDAELKAQAAALGTRNVQFLGYIPDSDKVALLSLCRGVVLPSHLRAEAFGVSLLEGAMFGKPMISTEIGTGTTFVNIDGETGIVVPPGDPLALRNAMRSLATDAALAEAMGKRAEERYWHEFTAAKMVATYVDVYRGLAKRRGAQDSGDAGFRT